MIAIFKRELKSYFHSPLGYIFLVVILFFSGQFFSFVISQNSSYFQMIFSSLFTIVITVIPLLTMRLISEEKKNKTDQLLLTSPINVRDIVIGKYLAAYLVYFISISATIIFGIIFSSFSPIDWSLFLGNFLGLFLLGGAIISIGLFISSLTENQMISAIVTFATMMFILTFDSFISAMPTTITNMGFLTDILQKITEFSRNILSSLSFIRRYDDFMNGILNISHIVFFISVIVVFNFFAIRVINRKKFS